MALDMTISSEDEKKIKECDYLQKMQQVIIDVELHKNVEVGSVFLISYKGYNGVTYQGGKDNPEKYVVIRNDNGFLFTKRIISGGELGKSIKCITIEYPSSSYTFVPDPNYVDAILLDDETNYDPASAEKDLAKRKGKSRRINEAKRLVFDDEDVCLAEVSKFKVGDKIWTSYYSYCEKIEEYEITAIIPNQRTYYRRNSDLKKPHIDIKVKTTDPTHWSHNNGGSTFTSDELIKKTSGNYRIFFKVKPTKLEDVT